MSQVSKSSTNDHLDSTIGVAKREGDQERLVLYNSQKKLIKAERDMHEKWHKGKKIFMLASDSNA